MNLAQRPITPTGCADMTTYLNSREYQAPTFPLPYLSHTWTPWQQHSGNSSTPSSRNHPISSYSSHAMYNARLQQIPCSPEREGRRAVEIMCSGSRVQGGKEAEVAADADCIEKSMSESIIDAINVLN